MISLMSAPSALDLRHEQPGDAAAIEALLNHAFGPGRFTKVSERVREFALPRQDLSFCAWQGPRLVGSVRMSQIRIGNIPAIFLGPLAVMADARKTGTGGLLTAKACNAAQAAGYPVVLLVGDEPYFARFRFTASTTKGVRMPGPVDPRRVLARGAEGPLEGHIRR